MIPVFVHRLRKWRRRRAGPVAVRVLLAVVAGAGLVAVMDNVEMIGRWGAAAPPSPQAVAPVSMTAAPSEKLEMRMEAAVREELRAKPDTDLSNLSVFEVPPPLRSIDGTSFRYGDDIVRLDGLTGPGALEICRSGTAPWSCGLQARAAFHNLIARRSFFCQPRRTLPDGAMAADCELRPHDSAPAGDIARLLVKQGWAQPSPGRETDFAAELGEAKAASLGLWRGGWPATKP